MTKQSEIILLANVEKYVEQNILFILYNGGSKYCIPK